jgi:hypothetical protein
VQIQTSPSLVLPPWILVTGKIRDPAFLYQRFAFFHKLKQAGLVEQVVFSTWAGELDNHPLIGELMAHCGFFLVETTEPKAVVCGHYLHQIVQLTNGLDACASDRFILRTRTDKCGPSDGFVEDQIVRLLSARDNARPCGGYQPRFQLKVGLPGYHNYISEIAPLLFWFNDRLYFGLREDLQKLLNLNILSFGFWNLIPEQTLFSHPFLDRSTILQQFFKAFPQGQIANKIYWGTDKNSAAYRSLIDFLRENSLFKFALFLERYLLHTHFFDMSSGQDFPMVNEFAGTPILNCSPDAFADVGESLRQDSLKMDLTKEADAARSFLQSQFEISHIIIQETLNGAMRRRLVTTPDEQISFRA